MCGNKVKHWFKSLVFIIVFFILFINIQDLLMLKDNAYKTKSFYELERDTCDVVFLGSSTMLAVQPMELYRKYGITAYNLAQHGQSFALTYYSLVDAIRYQHPKIVLVDVHTICRNDKDFKNEFAHFTLDNMPFSFNRIKAVFDVIQLEERLEFLFPLVRYHLRWVELNKNDFSEPYDYWRGTYFRGGWEAFSTDNIEIVPEDEMQELNALGQEYLEKIIQLCKKENVELILTNMPICVNTDAWNAVQKQYNYVKVVADENNIGYINFMHEDAGIDIGEDFYNYEHLNLKGALKISDYLADYIYENYNLENHLGDNMYAIWDTDCERYLQEKEEFLLNFDKRYKK